MKYILPIAGEKENMYRGRGRKHLKKKYPSAATFIPLL